MSESRKEVEEGDSSGGPPHQRAARATWLLWLGTDNDISKGVSWRKPDNSEIWRTLLQKQSEKGRMGCSVALQTTQGPISSFVYWPNSRSERCSYPFSDSFSTRHFSK